MSKAFDLTLHSLMFSKMLTAGVSPILLRLLIVIYTQQEANVRWNGEMSDNFPIKTLVVKERFLLLSPIVYTGGVIC